VSCTMASGHPISSAAQPAPVPQPTAVPSSNPSASHAASPPTRQNLRMWWKNFSKGQGKDKDAHGNSSFSSAPCFKEGDVDKGTPNGENMPSWLCLEMHKTSNGHSHRLLLTCRKKRLCSGAAVSPSGRRSTSLDGSSRLRRTASRYVAELRLPYMELLHLKIPQNCN
jgi:hypothetical protein